MLWPGTWLNKIYIYETVCWLLELKWKQVDCTPARCMHVLVRTTNTARKNLIKTAV